MQYQGREESVAGWWRSMSLSFADRTRAVSALGGFGGGTAKLWKTVRDSYPAGASDWHGEKLDVSTIESVAQRNGYFTEDHDVVLDKWVLIALLYCDQSLGCAVRVRRHEQCLDEFCAWTYTTMSNRRSSSIAPPHTRPVRFRNLLSRISRSFGTSAPRCINHRSPLLMFARLV